MDTTSILGSDSAEFCINVEMGAKFALTEAIQLCASAGMIPVPSTIAINLETHIDDGLLDPDNLDAFYAIYDALKINLEM